MSVATSMRVLTGGVRHLTLTAPVSLAAAQSKSGAVKRPASAFIMFKNERGKAIREKNPAMALTMAVVAKQTSQEWLSLEQKQKNMYENKYASDMEKYREYKSSLTDLEKEAIAKERSIRSSKNKIKKLTRELEALCEDKPKKPMNPFLLFARGIPQPQGLRSSDRLKRAAEEWPKMSEDKKEKFEIMFSKSQKEYDAQKKTWTDKVTKDGRLEKIKTLKTSIAALKKE